MSKQGQKKETDFGAVSSWLEENVLPMLMEKCASPLEVICLLTSDTLPHGFTGKAKKETEREFTIEY